MKRSIADIRTDYRKKVLLENEAAGNALEQFSKWWDEAIESELEEVNAMALSTLDENGFPDARIVLLKDFDAKGFVFFTNYNSLKGRQIQKNPNVCLLFFWKELERQVKIIGRAEKINDKESDEYFCSRPLGSRIGAWCSPQSKVIANREVLEKNVTYYTQIFKDKEVARPPHWGGYLIKPVKMEFWQGRSNRLHDRLLYEYNNGTWSIKRLAP